MAPVLPTLSYVHKPGYIIPKLELKFENETFGIPKSIATKFLKPLNCNTKTTLANYHN